MRSKGREGQEGVPRVRHIEGDHLDCTSEGRRRVRVAKGPRARQSAQVARVLQHSDRGLKPQNLAVWQFICMDGQQMNPSEHKRLVPRTKEDKAQLDQFKNSEVEINDTAL